MNTSKTSKVAVNWSEIFNSNTKDVVNFAAGSLSFKGLKSRCTGEARKEVLALAKRNVVESRRLARRACQRRKLTVVTTKG